MAMFMCIKRTFSIWSVLDGLLVQVDAEMALQEIWNAKKLYEQEKQSPVHLQDFLYLFLVRSGLSDAVPHACQQQVQCSNMTSHPPLPPLPPS